MTKDTDQPAYTDADVRVGGKAIVAARVSKEGGMSPLDTATAVLDAVVPEIVARAKVEALERVEDFARLRATTWRARTGGDAERDWLDLLALLERERADEIEAGQ